MGGAGARASSKMRLGQRDCWRGSAEHEKKSTENTTGPPIEETTNKGRKTQTETQQKEKRMDIEKQRQRDRLARRDVQWSHVGVQLLPPFFFQSSRYPLCHRMDVSKIPVCLQRDDTEAYHSTLARTLKSPITYFTSYVQHRQHS